MTLEDKVASAKDQTVGKAKEVIGDVSGDEKLEAEGKAQGILGKAKDILGDAKDKVEDAVEDVAGKFNDSVDNLKEKHEHQD
ncbi:CsbD family protein [Weissella diestrammenae]|uniref:CsbD family protein n=1 Tax=Weissella diestrammenae TaxID=1162633 RepID=A0A7G9T5B9_9LACO|nr:CsbD family protein [Weissella diestrammenae]MCM0583152.1 CsbD family protein [Weissella diestrammenae]QNN75294.1 CsbD family protein [Weissella diestrammenae]